MRQCEDATARDMEGLLCLSEACTDVNDSTYIRISSTSLVNITEPPSSPHGLWQNLPTTILVKNQHPHGARFMPAAPILRSGGVVASPLVLEEDWKVYLTWDAKSRSLLSDEQHALYLRYLQNPAIAANATAAMSRPVAASLKSRVLQKYTLDGSDIYRMANKKNHAPPMPSASLPISSPSLITKVSTRLTTGSLRTTTASRSTTSSGYSWNVECAFLMRRKQPRHLQF